MSTRQDRRGITSPSFPLASQFRILATLFVAISLALQALGIYYELARLKIDREYFALDPETLVIKRVGDRGKEAGFQPGDRLLRVNGQEVSVFLDYRQTISAMEPNSRASLTFERDDGTVVLPATIETRDVGVSFLVRHLVGLAFLAMGTLVVMQRPRDKASRLFFLTALLLGQYFSLHQTESIALVYVQVVDLTLLPALALHFFLTFPKDRLLAKTHWWFVLYLPSVILMILTMTTLSQAIAAGTGIYNAPHYWDMITASFVYLSLGAILGLVSLGYTYTTTQRPIVKRQVQWIMWGLSCAIAANIADIILTLMDMQTYEVSTFVLLAALPLPFSFAFAILRYRLLDIDLVINRSAVYGVLTAILAALYLLLISLLSHALGVASGSSSYTLIVFSSALIIGLLVTPLRASIQSVIDRVFFQRQLDFQHALIEWSQELGTSLRFTTVRRLLLQEVPEQMAIEKSWLLALNKDETHLEPLLAQANASDQEMEGDTDLTISTRSAIAARLVRPNRVLMLNAKEEGLAEVCSDVPPAWRQAGVHVALPLISGDNLIGIYLLGRKRLGDIYLRRELDLLRTLSNQAAVAIANARLYEEIHGISQRLEEKVGERTNELRDFIVAIYHELRTPLTAIQGYTTLLLESSRAEHLSEKQMRYVTTVNKNVERLMRLVDDLANVSKIDDGRLEIYPEPLALQEAVEETIGTLSNAIDEKELELEISLEPESAMVLADPQRLVQILTNLLSNACRYTLVGGQIKLTSSCLHGSLEITIEDTGIGIGKEELDHIFERFFRGDDPLVQDQPGTGLGLSIAKSLVKLHGGQLWVKSDVGKGSTFGFTLPLAEAADES
jgi:signal transduction histidine kinase